MAGRQRGAARARRAETRGCGCARLPHRPSAARVAAGEAQEAGGGGEDPRGGRRAHDHFFREVMSHLSHPSPCPGQRRAPDRPLAAAAPLPRRVRQGRRALRDERCEQRLFTPAAVNRWSSSARRARRRRAAGPRCDTRPSRRQTRRCEQRLFTPPAVNRSVPTTDMEVRGVGEVLSLFNECCASSLFPFLEVRDPPRFPEIPGDSPPPPARGAALFPHRWR